VGLIACVVVILLVVVGVMLLHLHHTNEPQNEVPISEMETEEDVVFSGDFSVDW
jgi:flagellar basal body-associated protein FliL